MRDNRAPDEVSYFMGHYVPWRRQRLRAIVEHYGRYWFRDKRVLELGCGYGHMGLALAYLGAQVTFSDGRQKHLDEIAELWATVPPERLIRANLESEWPFEGHWDLILHQGLLYHLTDWGFGLEMAAKCCDRMVLECETLDSSNLDATRVVKEDAGAMDAAVEGQGVRVPAVRIEEELARAGFEFEMYRDTSLNTAMHDYTWPVTDKGQSTAKQRRWWWCWRG